MRILHVNLANGWRGGERQTLLLMQGLRDLGFGSSLLARKGSEMARRASELNFTVLEAGPPFLRAVTKLRNFDIIHAHETKALQLASIASLCNAARLVVTRRVDFTPGTNPFTRWKYRRSDRVVAVSQFVSTVLADWGLAEQQRDVVHDAVETDRCIDEERVAALRERFAGRRVVGCVAALVISHKDHPTLLRAMQVVNRERDDVVLVLIGDGVDRERLEVQAIELGLTNIHFEGFASDVQPYYNVMDVFALTSRVEGLGSSVLEAFAARVPVVATSAGGLPEVVRHEETGWLAPVGDDEAVARGILRMVDDGDFARRCADRAAELVRDRHTPETMAREYLRIYEEILGGAQD